MSGYEEDHSSLPENAHEEKRKRRNRDLTNSNFAQRAKIRDCTRTPPHKLPRASFKRESRARSSRETGMSQLFKGKLALLPPYLLSFVKVRTAHACVPFNVHATTTGEDHGEARARRLAASKPTAAPPDLLPHLTNQLRSDGGSD